MAFSSLPIKNTTPGSANYQPSTWSYEYIQSLSSNYTEESFGKQVEKLKEEVRMMLIDNTVNDPLHQLELIDTLQRLGVSYQFKGEIKIILCIIHTNYRKKEDSLYAVALRFRLLRQHGFDISAEIFSNFRDEKGSFEPCLSSGCKGILYLYEAAYFLEEGEESIFHDARNFTTAYLKEYVKLKHNEDEYLSTMVKHALEYPLHWRMLRLEARWFIEVYGQKQDMNPTLLKLAKLDFNVVQAKHQEDLKGASRWWRNAGLRDSNDRLMECFLRAVGSLFEPQFGYCRTMLTNINALITTIYDVYDANGSNLDQLKLFTEAVERWDVNATEELPPYMKKCFFVLHNSINEIAFDALKEQGIHIISYLKKMWADLCKSYLVEAKWCNSGYIPTLEEFLENAWISIGTPLILLHVYCFITNPTSEEVSKCFQEYHNVIRCISLVTRLANDLRTSSDKMKRGNAPKSIKCYRHESGASEEDARKHMLEVIVKTWMKINKEQSACNNALIGFGRNIMRTALCMCRHGDGHGIYYYNVLSLLVNPIPLPNNGQKEI